MAHAQLKDHPSKSDTVQTLIVNGKKKKKFKTQRSPYLEPEKSPNFKKLKISTNRHVKLFIKTRNYNYLKNELHAFGYEAKPATIFLRGVVGGVGSSGGGGVPCNGGVG